MANTERFRLSIISVFIIISVFSSAVNHINMSIY